MLQVLALALLCGPFAAQPPQTPDTPAGRQFARWLEVFNRGQRDEIQKFIGENDPQARIDQQMDFRRMTGGFDFKKVEESTPYKLTGIVKERDSDNIARFTMEVVSPPRTRSSSSASGLYLHLRTLPRRPPERIRSQRGAAS